jgi:hypothetical protein
MRRPDIKFDDAEDILESVAEVGVEVRIVFSTEKRAGTLVMKSLIFNHCQA